MIDIFKANKDVTLIAIGPLTNIALAILLEPDFVNWPKEMIILGGNVYGAGNVNSFSTSEFNFNVDPEAAHVVLKEMKVPVTLVPWEVVLVQVFHVGRGRIRLRLMLRLSLRGDRTFDHTDI